MNARKQRARRGRIAPRMAKFSPRSIPVLPMPQAVRPWTLRAALLASAAGVMIAPGAAIATPPGQTELPTGGRVTGGTAGISSSGAAMTVTQSSQKAIIQWNTFNIGSQASVAFQQPNAAAVALNRVLSATPSQIYGQLSANGQVFLINPSGITFGAGAQVNVGGLVASTLDIANQDFNSGNYKFTGGNSGGAIRNKGTITAASGGYIGFLAPKIVNKGNLVTGRLGTVALAAGDQVTLSFDGNGQMSAQVDPAAVRTLIENHNLIAAPDGRVIMSAEAATVLMGGVINNSGIIEADSLTSNGGVVTLEASNAITNAGTISASGATGGGIGDGGNIKLVSDGTTTVSGNLSARGGSAGGNGGTVETSGHVVTISGATVDTRAPHGKTGNWLLDPYDLTVTDGGSSSASGAGGTFTSGPGGSTVSNTDIDNALAATNVTLQTGGSAGDGNGDIFVNGAIYWTSGSTLTLNAFRNIDVNANITHAGTGGALALNPNAGGAGGMLSVTDGFTVTLNHDAALSIGGISYTLISTAAELQAMANNLGGHYAVGNDLDMSGFTFTPIGSISSVFSGVFEGLGHGIANLTINEPSTSYVGLFGASSGTLSDTHLWGESVTGSAYVGGLAGYNLGLITNSSVQGTITGGSGSSSFDIGGLIGCNCANLQQFGSPIGTIVDSYAIANVTTGSGASGIGGLAGANEGLISDSFAFGETVSGASASSNVGGLVGINSSSQHGITATISHSFAKNTVSAGDGSTAVGGLVGFNNSIINNGSYANGTVTAGTSTAEVGGLVGDNSAIGVLSGGGVIEGAWAIGPVTAGAGSQQIGGLAGVNSGTITNSYSVTPVTTGSGSMMVGGLVGRNISSVGAGTISNSYALGPVAAGSGSTDVGGLVGDNIGLVTASYTSGMNVTSGDSSTSIGGMIGLNEAGGIVDHTYNYGYNNLVSVGTASGGIGGLVGTNSGAIRNGSYSTGTVTAGSGSGSIGGLVGFNNPTGTIDSAWAVGTVTASAAGVVGGLVGSNSQGTITNSYAVGTVRAVDATLVGGLVGYNAGLISGSYALGTVIGYGEVGGLVGRNGFVSTTGTVTDSYTYTTVSGTYDVGGLVGSNYLDGTVAGSHTYGGQVSGSGSSSSSSIGGLIGYNDGTINNSYSTANVQAGASAHDVGGMVGFIDQFGGGISGGYSTGSVTVGSGAVNVGGLVGRTFGSITSSYATGNVTAGDGSFNVGGLAGVAGAGFHGGNGVVVSSYATGSVSVGSGSTQIGGLVGAAQVTTVSASWAAGPVSAGDNSTDVGGLVGIGSGSISSSAAFGSVSSGNGVQNVGGLIGEMGGSVDGSNASGNVTVGTNSNAIGSLIGLVHASTSTVTNSFGSGTVTAGPGSTNVGGQVGETQ